MDIFRVFDSLNYLPNLMLGIDAAGNAGKYEKFYRYFIIKLNYDNLLQVELWKLPFPTLGTYLIRHELNILLIII